MSTTQTGLPQGWTIKVSSTHNKEYFYNSGTKESSWEPPFGSDTDKVTEYVKQFKSNGNKPVIPSDGKIRVSHLLIKNNQSRRPKSWKNDKITLTRDESIAQLRKFEKQIKSGEVTLSELAQTESDCSSHEKSGDLGFFGKGQMQPPFEEASFSLNVGDISDIIETDSGVHLIQRTA